MLLNKHRTRFLPLLLLYIFIVLTIATNTFEGDEERYVNFAHNLTHGYYSPVNDVYLWNGPGYPIILAPFVLLKLPLLIAKLLNALLLFGAVFYFYKTLLFYGKEKYAMFLSYLLGIYPPYLIYLHLLLTEILSIFLICGFMFHLCKLYYDGKNLKSHLFFASFYLAYLVLTKIFFAYVILAGILFFLALYFWKRKSGTKKALLIYLFALVFCLPYLFYTYSLTNKIFYWGSSGGQSLYWMSTPYGNEFGDWHDFDTIGSNPNLEKYQKFSDELNSISSIQRDDRLKKEAIRNITQNPVKYLNNLAANIGRMLFNYPYSYTYQKMSTYFYIIPNMFIVVFSIICLCPYYIYRRLIPGEVHYLIIFFLFSFWGSSLVSAYPRQFTILVPILILWMVSVLTRTIKVELKDIFI